jgi:hypothetical protein
MNIIELSNESGLVYYGMGKDRARFIHHLEAFAALVAAHEREELEKIDWTALMREGCLVTWGDAQELGDRVLAAIRARGTT